VITDLHFSMDTRTHPRDAQPAEAPPPPPHRRRGLKGPAARITTNIDPTRPPDPGRRASHLRNSHDAEQEERARLLCFDECSHL